MGLVLVVVLNWSQFLALFGLGADAPRFEIAWKASASRLPTPHESETK
jgi:hypothetical protein